MYAFGLWPSLKYAPVSIKSLVAKQIAPEKNITKVVTANLWRHTIESDVDNIVVKQYK